MKDPCADYRIKEIKGFVMLVSLFLNIIRTMYKRDTTLLHYYLFLRSHSRNIYVSRCKMYADHCIKSWARSSIFSNFCKDLADEKMNIVPQGKIHSKRTYKSTSEHFSRIYDCFRDR